MKHLVWALSGTLALASLPASGATAYISDELTVPLRSGPSNQHRIIHAGLPSGTSMETISVNEEAGFTQIRTARGTEGWVLSRYLKFEPIAAMQLETANQKLDQVRQQLSEAEAQIATLQQNNRQQSTVSLQEENARLRDELDDLAEDRARLQDNRFNQALMIGGGLLFLGLIAGVAIKSRPQRSAWN